ncbi:aminopeptidase O-like [Saccostrea echinata]|uniref:aminopeptidase O-like n=1 Tax=Saccostrea echinata TaxID=191078 RepID=UPI002A7FBD94|nr:aminopeptidase O-like [Saccostrea echinata]
MMNENIEKRGEYDLPLSANISEIQVHHYKINLQCDLQNQVFHGSTTVFFTQRLESNPKTERLSDLCQVIRSSSPSYEACERGTNSYYPESSYVVQEPSSAEIQTVKSDEQLMHLSQNSEETYQPVSKGSTDLGRSSIDLRKTHFVFKRSLSWSENDVSPVKQMKSSDQSFENTQISNNIPRKNFVSEGNTRIKDFTLILDCHKLEIQSVSEEKVTSSIDSETFISPDCSIENSQTTCTSLKYELGDQCLKIQVPDHKKDKNELRAINISYKTLDGHSLKWTKDQDGNDCVYTHGHWINNRSLFPSQDVPEALATWQAFVKVPQGLTVIMSGDHNPQRKHLENRMECFYFWTSFPMPSSTLSLAVGYWKECKKPQTQENDVIPYRVFGPKILMTSMNAIHQYIPLCLEEVTAVLGQHPMKRQDILVVPASFDSLGMASPSILYLSQSLLHADLSMFYRLAHEVCHTWYGIVIGPADWTEEWLTEGFCTYLEDIIHTRVLRRLGRLSEEEESDVRDLRDLVKFRILTAEIQNTEETLQTLKPDCTESGSNKTFVKNGMNPEKKYLQVHYLKGYFLLRYLEKLAGSMKFLECLGKYVQQFHGKLVSSQEVLQFFIHECEEISAAGLTASELSSIWLECSGLPSAVSGMIEKGSKIVQNVKNQVDLFCERCRRKKSEPMIIAELKGYSPDELILFLELLLDENEIPWFGLSSLKKKYHIGTCNAEIKHRWCELIIKCRHRSSSFYKDIQDFLIDHQGMGVYLYGEMMLSGRKALINLAHKCFNQLQQSMGIDTYTAVHSMLFGE